MTASSNLTGTFNDRDHEFRHAAFMDDFAKVEKMLAEGIDINRKDGAGWTPLMIAAAKADSPGITYLLIARGADPAICDNDGKTALEWSMIYKKDAAAEILRRDPADIRAEYAAHLAQTATTLGQSVKAMKPLRLK